MHLLNRRAYSVSWQLAKTVRRWHYFSGHVILNEGVVGRALTLPQNSILRARRYAVLSNQSVLSEILRRDLSYVQLNLDIAVAAILHTQQMRKKKQCCRSLYFLNVYNYNKNITDYFTILKCCTWFKNFK